MTCLENKPTTCHVLACVVDVQNKFYVTLDWCKTKVFGRDTGGELERLAAASRPCGWCAYAYQLKVLI